MLYATRFGCDDLAVKRFVEMEGDPTEILSSADM
jgi:hypothetical protein